MLYPIAKWGEVRGVQCVAMLADYRRDEVVMQRRDEKSIRMVK